MWQRAGQGRLDVTFIRVGGSLLRGRVVPAIQAARDHHEILVRARTDRKMVLPRPGRQREVPVGLRV
jgi:hypothetical protein